LAPSCASRPDTKPAETQINISSFLSVSEMGEAIGGKRVDAVMPFTGETL